MSGHIPALPVPVEIEPVRKGQVVPQRGVLRRWLLSPLGTAAADLAPEALKLVGRALQTQSTAGRPLGGLPQTGANGLTLSEVEIDVSLPFVRRVVVRTASAWSLSPEVALAERRKKRRGRLGLGAVSLAGLAVLGVAASRRIPVSLPSLTEPEEE